MPEYLIRTADGPGGWPSIPKDRLPDVLGPMVAVPCALMAQVTCDWALLGCEVVFSGEDAGWRVWFEGDTAGHDIDAVVSQVAQQG